MPKKKLVDKRNLPVNTRLRQEELEILRRACEAKSACMAQFLRYAALKEARSVLRLLADDRAGC